MMNPKKLLREHLNLLLLENKQLDILTNKVGFSEEISQYLIDACGKLAIWMANGIINRNTAPRTDVPKKDFIDSFNNHRQGHFQRVFGEGIRLIMDWLRHPLTPQQDLKTLTIDNAIRLAHRFHEEMKEGGGDIDYKEVDDIIINYPETKGGVKYYWVYIPKNFCSKESERMGHCGRTNWNNHLYSLRSVRPYGKGHTITDSHVTIAWGANEERPYIYQCKGKKNNKPKPEYHPYIFSFIEHLLEEDSFWGFAHEYDSKNDYGWGDMTDEQIKEIYQKKPELFEKRSAKRILSARGIIEYTPTPMTFVLDVEPGDIEETYMSNNDYRKGMISDFICGNYHDYYDGWSSDDWEHYADDFNHQNEARVIKIIADAIDVPEEDVKKFGVEEVLKDENYEEELEELKRLMCDAVCDVQTNDYGEHVRKAIIEGLEKFGEVVEADCDEVKININLQKFIDEHEINDDVLDEMLDACDNSPKCVFNELLGDGTIDKATWWVDDRYSGHCSREAFNEYMADRLGELE